MPDRRDTEGVMIRPNQPYMCCAQAACDDITICQLQPSNMHELSSINSSWNGLCSHQYPAVAGVHAARRV